MDFTLRISKSYIPFTGKFLTIMGVVLVIESKADQNIIIVILVMTA